MSRSPCRDIHRPVYDIGVRPGGFTSCSEGTVTTPIAGRADSSRSDIPAILLGPSNFGTWSGELIAGARERTTGSFRSGRAAGRGLPAHRRQVCQKRVARVGCAGGDRREGEGPRAGATIAACRCFGCPCFVFPVITASGRACVSVRTTNQTVTSAIQNLVEASLVRQAGGR